GDVDFDGEADLLIGAPRGQSVEFNAGHSFLFSGHYISTSTTLRLDEIDSSNTLYAFGDVQRSHLGRSVGALGDINGDSVSDFFIGKPAPPSSVQLGQMFVFSPTSSSQTATYRTYHPVGPAGRRAVGHQHYPIS